MFAIINSALTTYVSTSVTAPALFIAAPVFATVGMLLASPLWLIAATFVGVLQLVQRHAHETPATPATSPMANVSIVPIVAIPALDRLATLHAEIMHNITRSVVDHMFNLPVISYIKHVEFVQASQQAIVGFVIQGSNTITAIFGSVFDNLRGLYLPQINQITGIVSLLDNSSAANETTNHPTLSGQTVLLFVGFASCLLMICICIVFAAHAMRLKRKVHDVQSHVRRIRNSTPTPSQQLQMPVSIGLGSAVRATVRKQSVLAQANVDVAIRELKDACDRASLREV